jgi:hypothetical protein
MRCLNGRIASSGPLSRLLKLGDFVRFAGCAIERHSMGLECQAVAE